MDAKPLAFSSWRAVIVLLMEVSARAQDSVRPLSCEHK